MTTTALMVKMVMDRWQGSIKNLNSYLDSFTDEQLLQEIAPGKNRGVYILGHLVAVHDDMLILLDMGQKMYPEWNEVFIKSPDKSGNTLPAPQVLRKAWTNQCEKMQQLFDGLSTDDWFSRHTAVSAEDFAREPHRNKLNIIITRTSHLQYHTGQLVLLK